RYYPCSTHLFSTDPTTPEFYTLSLHDALPISQRGLAGVGGVAAVVSRLSAAGLLAGEVDVNPQPPEQADRAHSDLGVQGIDDACDKERDSHPPGTPCDVKFLVFRCGLASAGCRRSPCRPAFAPCKGRSRRGATV